MELAIPILALGGMYFLNNDSSSSSSSSSGSRGSGVGVGGGSFFSSSPSFVNPEGNETKKKEGFQSAGRNIHAIPGMDDFPSNYPVQNTNILPQSMQAFVSPNAATDKYFNQTYFEEMDERGEKISNVLPNIYSMSGNFLEREQFKHNNMVPFVGGKIKGYTYDANIAESVMDNMIGTGSQMIRKVEQPPLFRPEENIQYTHGAPNMNDFYQSRINPGMNINNVKPFESVTVGPGLGKGYTTEGSGGFNSGMEDRNAWMPKTVDEMRVLTNPKMEFTYDGLEGPAMSKVVNVGIEGRVEKNRPDRFYINSQDRWFTTTGSEKAETLRPEQELGILKRSDCQTNYMGPAMNSDKSGGNYVASQVAPTKRQQFSETGGVFGVRCSKNAAPDLDYQQKKAMMIEKNNRSVNYQPDTIRNAFGGAIGAVVAPLMDILRPSQKEELQQNMRIFGTGGSGVDAGYANNPNDVLKTTMKETTLYQTQGFINNQREGNYVQNMTPLNGNNRDTTNCGTFGNVGGKSNQYGDMNYSMYENQTNNDLKSQTIYNRMNAGSMGLFNHQMNICNMPTDCSPLDNYFGAPNSIIKTNATNQNYGVYNLPNKTHLTEGTAEYNNNRLDPALLKAFNDNPFTHSLTNSV